MNLTKNQKTLLQLRVSTARTRDGQHKMEIRLLNPVALSLQTPKGTDT